MDLLDASIAVIGFVFFYIAGFNNALLTRESRMTRMCNIPNLISLCQMFIEKTCSNVFPRRHIGLILFAQPKCSTR